MATAKISGKNTMGFKHRFYRGLIYGGLAFIGCRIIGDCFGQGDLGELVGFCAFLLIPFLYQVIGVRRERFAPALFTKRDPLLPRNDVELWCVATFAIWAAFHDIAEGWPLICGGHKNKKFIHAMQCGLEEDWDIHSCEECLEVIHSLVDRHFGEEDPHAGWDLCRATQLLGMMYAVDWISRDDLDLEFSRAGQAIQQRFHSWDELINSYLEGYAAWRRRIGGEGTEWSIAARSAIYEQLKSIKHGPYSVSWDTELSWIPGFSDRTA